MILFFVLLFTQSVFSSPVFNTPQSSSSTTDYGAISTATAATGRASVEPTESPILNPAIIPYARGYFFTSDYAAMASSEEFTVGLTDNLPETIVPTSLMYSQLNGNDQTTTGLTTQDIRLAFGNLVTKTFAFGMTVRNRTDTLQLNQYRQTNVMLGSLVTFGPNLGVALVLENLISPDAQVPVDYRLVPGASVGINYNYKKTVRFKLDMETAQNDSLNLPSIGTGLEAHWNDWLVFRLGLRKILEQDTDEYGIGVGFMGPKFALHYGYQNCPQQDLLTRHAVDLAIPIW